MKRLDRYGQHQQQASQRQEKAQAKQEQSFLKQQLAALELNDRVYQILQDADVVTVGDVVNMEDDQLLALDGFGPKALEEVRTKVEEARSLVAEPA
jgi:DNA-directed RNA polymerase alpha subunit